MPSAADLCNELQTMDLVAFTTPAPDKLIVTLVQRSEDGAYLPLPAFAVDQVKALLSANAYVASMSAVYISDMRVNGWTAEIIVPPQGAKVVPLKDGE